MLKTRLLPKWISVGGNETILAYRPGRSTFEVMLRFPKTAIFG